MDTTRRDQDVPGAPPVKIPLRARWRMRARAVLIRLAVRLVGRRDAVVVSRQTYAAALDRLAQLAEWGERANVFRGKPGAARAYDVAIEDVTRLVVLAAELGNPSLQLAGLQERFTLARLHAMSRNKRRRLQYEAALEALGARLERKRPATEAKALASELG